MEKKYLLGLISQGLKKLIKDVLHLETYTLVLTIFVLSGVIYGRCRLPSGQGISEGPSTNSIGGHNSHTNNSESSNSVERGSGVHKVSSNSGEEVSGCTKFVGGVSATSCDRGQASREHDLDALHSVLQRIRPITGERSSFQQPTGPVQAGRSISPSDGSSDAGSNKREHEILNLPGVEQIHQRETSGQKRLQIGVFGYYPKGLGADFQILRYKAVSAQAGFGYSFKEEEFHPEVSLAYNIEGLTKVTHNTSLMLGISLKKKLLVGIRINL